ncbi:OsmC family protein [Bacillus toyonensis]|uniref:OsmC family protein n=1 Tax=Bacillus toyonensis TaxID=155322 RepID=UPI000BF22CD6|nr:OsmC family protein [Bacillus toyonensis]PEO48329.1 osmotically inducible protein C [Bacillus toyonensis]
MNNHMINGINIQKLKEFSKKISKNTTEGITQFNVHTEWLGGTKSVTKVQEWRLGDQRYSRNFNILIDEPKQLHGENHAANPQEFLMAAFNACVAVGYVIQAAIEDIQLTKLEIITEGEIDLRGFLGIDSNVASGYEQIQCKVKISSNGTKEQIEKIHEKVIQTSPNYWNILNAVEINMDLMIE